MGGTGLEPVTPSLSSRPDNASMFALRLVAFITVVLAFTAGAPAADAPPARLLFQVFPFKGFDAPDGLGVSNADGSGFVDLTASLVRDHHAAYEAAWSPDGSAVAFALYRTYITGSGVTAGEIYIVDAAGSEPRRLTFDATDTGVSNGQPAWSPDGTRIAWLKRTPRGCDVWVMNADGSGQRAVTVDGADGAANTNLAWSSDGRQLAWLKRVGKTEGWEPDANVWLAHADGSGARALTTSSDVVRGPIWQPGGSLILYGTGPQLTKLHIVDPSVGPPGIVTPSAGDTNASWGDPDGSDPSWSPSGTRIAWGDRAGVEVATLDGRARRVTSSNGYRVTWSPDESKLAFVHEQDLPVARSDCACANVYVVDTAGGRPRNVSGREGVADFSWFDPLWWPDSARLSVGGEFGIVNVNADGTCRRPLRIVSDDSASGPLLWQPGTGTLPPLPDCVDLELTGGFSGETAPVGSPPPVDLTLANRGNQTATGLSLVAVPSSGAVHSDAPGCDNGGAVLHCALAPLAGLATTPLRLTVSAGRPGTFTLTVTVAATGQTAQTTKLPVQLLPCSTTGTDKSETIVGTNGRDTICGFGGDDMIDARGGNDWIDGGAGWDTITGGPGNDTISGDIGHDTITGGPGNDTISGGNGPDRIYGGPGNDHITGGLYPDRLNGGSGNDWIDAADGYVDTVDCGPGNDTIVTAYYPRDNAKNCEHVVVRK